MEITFIVPYSDVTAYGVRILSAISRKERYSTILIFIPHILEPSSVRDLRILATAIKEISNNSSLLGISFFSCYFSVVAKLTKELKSTLSVPIIWGSKHISAQPHDALGLADMVCIGEGDISLKNLVRSIDRGEDCQSIDGIWFPGHTKPEDISLPPLIEDLDSLPYPDYSCKGHYLWDGTQMHAIDTDGMAELFLKYTPGPYLTYPIMGSRGCPYNCSYCYTYRDLYPCQKYLRFRSPSHIIGELGNIYLKFPFLYNMVLSDDNFLFMKEAEIKEFAELYKNNINLPLRCLAHPLNISKTKLEILVDAGLTNINMGIQSGSKKTLQ